MAATKEILTATEASKYLRMRLETFKDLAEAGEIPGDESIPVVIGDLIKKISSRGSDPVIKAPICP